MNAPRQHVCASCGTALSTTGGRCPMCGAQQPDDARPEPPAPEAEPGSRYSTTYVERVAAVMGGVLVLALVGFLIFKLAAGAGAAPKETQAAPSVAPPPPPTSTGHPGAGMMDASQALVRGTKMATAWNADARLVSYVADHVENGRVDTAGGGRIVLVFAAPGSEGMRLGTPVGKARYVVVVDGKGVHASQRKSGPPAWSVAPPDCPLDIAWRKVVASGVPSSKPLGMRYAIDRKRQRAVWTAATRDRPGQTRTLDGRTCAILTR